MKTNLVALKGVSVLCGTVLHANLVADLEALQQFEHGADFARPVLEEGMRAETLADLDHPEIELPLEWKQALAGSPAPSSSGMDATEYALASLRWEAKWRAALKRIRAEAVLAEARQ